MNTRQTKNCTLIKDILRRKTTPTPTVTKTGQTTVCKEGANPTLTSTYDVILSGNEMSTNKQTNKIREHQGFPSETTLQIAQLVWLWPQWLRMAVVNESKLGNYICFGQV